MIKIERFYGSCGHITDTIISDERFEELSKPITEPFEYKNPVIEEDGNLIVKIIPFRFCVCRNCMNEVLEDLKND